MKKVFRKRLGWIDVRITMIKQLGLWILVLERVWHGHCTRQGQVGRTLYIIRRQATHVGILTLSSKKVLAKSQMRKPEPSTGSCGFQSFDQRDPFSQVLGMFYQVELEVMHRLKRRIKQFGKHPLGIRQFR
ncbi:hypothetical protein G6F62_015238 [Rhizopus arrhizus]|nr:hypothetical protein G6F62_015238 [Rhizopus arrhizus]